MAHVTSRVTAVATEDIVYEQEVAANGHNCSLVLSYLTHTHYCQYWH